MTNKSLVEEVKNLSGDIHVVDGVQYYLLEFIVDKEEAAKFGNCAGLFE